MVSQSRIALPVVCYLISGVRFSRPTAAANASTTLSPTAFTSGALGAADAWIERQLPQLLGGR
jgi:hypothetical protein